MHISDHNTVATSFTGHTPEETWLASLGEQYGIEPVVAVKKRTKRLRRMQRQNFIQRAVHNVVELFSRNKEVA